MLKKVVVDSHVELCHQYNCPQPLQFIGVRSWVQMPISTKSYNSRLGSYQNVLAHIIRRYWLTSFTGKLILDNMRHMRRCIFLLEHHIFVGVYDAYGELQVVTKQCNVAFNSQ